MMITYYHKHQVSNTNIRLWREAQATARILHTKGPFSAGRLPLLSSTACCDNAHRGRADVRCQQHICIQPDPHPFTGQTMEPPPPPPRLLHHLSFPPIEKKKLKKKKEGEDREELFYKNQYPLSHSNLLK